MKQLGITGDYYGQTGIKVKYMKNDTVISKLKQEQAKQCETGWEQSATVRNRGERGINHFRKILVFF